MKKSLDMFMSQTPKKKESVSGEGQISEKANNQNDWTLTLKDRVESEEYLEKFLALKQEAMKNMPDEVSSRYSKEKTKNIIKIR